MNELKSYIILALTQNEMKSFLMSRAGISKLHLHPENLQQQVPRLSRDIGPRRGMGKDGWMLLLYCKMMMIHRLIIITLEHIE